MAEKKPRCSFCGRPSNEVKNLIKGAELDGKSAHICNYCIDKAAEASQEKQAKRIATKEKPLRKPVEINKHLGQYIIGQERARKDIAVAVYNHYKRREAIRRGMTFDGVEIQKSNILMTGPTGCHRKGQKVVMFDGTFKAVEDVRVGDMLMGMDSTPRRVLELHHGHETMVEIQPVKGEPWVVNEGHILTLVRISRNHKKVREVVDVSLREWLGWSRTKKHIHKLLRVGVDFPDSGPLSIDPYFLGVLLGDGSLSGTPRVHTIDRPIVKEVYRQAKKWGLRVSRHESKKRLDACPTYGLAGRKHGVINPLALTLAGLDLWNESCGSKFIPHCYKTASRKDRLSLLAGLIDTDGSLNCNGFDFVNKSKALVDDMVFVARSLGFAAYPKPCVKKSQNGTEGTYYRTFISGHMDQIPVRLKEKKARKRKQVKNVGHVGFTTRHLPPEDYYGFVLDEDHRYLLEDFTVTHNTGKTEIARTIARELGVPFFVADASRFTQSGYVGDDVETVLQGLLEDADGDVERAEWGICFIDEVDKIARKSGRAVSGSRDITGEGVQQALLKIIEGSKVSIPPMLGQKVIASGSTGSATNIDSENILFICSGSFAGSEEIVRDRVNKSSGLGFGANRRKKELSLTECYEQLNEADILEFGLIPEFLGRLPILTTTLPLTEEQMVRILTEPKNALVKQFQALFKMDNLGLDFDEDALKAIGREANRRPTGARALRGITEALLKEYAYELPSQAEISGLRVTEEYVLGRFPEKNDKGEVTGESNPDAKPILVKAEKKTEKVAAQA